MIRIDSGFTNYFSNVYLTLPLSAVETQNTTAANCCSSVKYGQAAWRISLPLITKARSEKENLIISLCAFPVYRLSQMAQPAKTLSRHRFLWPICDSTDIELSFTFNRHMHSGRMDGRMDGWPETLQQRSHLKKQKAVFSGYVEIDATSVQHWQIAMSIMMCIHYLRTHDFLACPFPPLILLFERQHSHYCNCTTIVSVVEEMKIKHLTFVSYKWLRLPLWRPFLRCSGTRSFHFYFL